MRTSADDMTALIEQLSSELKPVRRGALNQRLVSASFLGAALSLAVVFWLWGPRPDLSRAITTVAFWIKEVFPLALGLAGLNALIKLSRPGGRAPAAITAAAFATVIMGAIALFQMLWTPASERMSLLMGASSGVCPWLILALSLPILLISLAAARATAPTRLRLAGAAVGLTAGGLSAFVYSIACDERALPFIFVWYGGPILVMSLIGAAIGPKTLRW